MGFRVAWLRVFWDFWLRVFTGFSVAWLRVFCDFWLRVLWV